MKKGKIDRRKFIQTSALVGLGAATTACSTAPKATPTLTSLDEAERNLLSQDLSGFNKVDATFQQRQPASDEQFDYIIVGAGAAGAVIAARLSQSGHSVCVIEAGKDYIGNKDKGTPTKNDALVPAAHSRSTEEFKVDKDGTVTVEHRPSLTWEFFVDHYTKDADRKKEKYEALKEVQNSDDPTGRNQNLGRVDHPGNVLYPRAAAIGGCSAHNAMILMYPDNKVWKGIESIARVDRAIPAELASKWSAESMWDLFSKRIAMPANLGVGPLGIDKPWLRFEVAEHDTSINGKPQYDMTVRQAMAAAVLSRAKQDEWKNSNKPEDASKPPRILSADFPALVPRTTAMGKRRGPRDLLIQQQQQAETSNIGGKIKILDDKLATRVLLSDDGTLSLGVEFVNNRSGLYQADPESRNHQLSGDPENRKKSALETFDQQWSEIIENKKVDRVTLKMGANGKPRGGVILAGGVFNTPQLLNLSGIGDAEVVAQYKKVYDKDGAKKIKRPVVRGVGKNLQDRYEVGIISQLPDKEYIDYLARCAVKPSPCAAELEKLMEHEFAQKDDGTPPAGKVEALKAFEEKHKLVAFGSNGLIGGIIKTSSVAEDRIPDLFVFAVAGRFAGYFPGWTKNSKSGKHVSWLVLKGHTRNKAGFVRLQRNASGAPKLNPLLVPEINFNSFAQGGAKDMTAMREGIVASLKAAKELKHKIIHPAFLADVDPEEVDAKTLDQFVYSEAWGHHASCTCPMGPESTGGVVDSSFKVHGTHNLFVADASVFPEIPGIFIVSSVYMLAERAAEIIPTKLGTIKKQTFNPQRKEFLSLAIERAFQRLRSI